MFGRAHPRKLIPAPAVLVSYAFDLSFVGGLLNNLHLPQAVAGSLRALAGAPCSLWQGFGNFISDEAKAWMLGFGITPR